MTTVTGAALARDQDGAVAQLHAIGLQRFGGRWWAYGENKAAGDRFQGVSCYTTTDLVHWRHEGLAMRVGEPGTVTGPDRIVERPRVLRCPATGRYVMYLHVDSPGYADARIGTAVADEPGGPFEFRAAFRWRGLASRDIGVFQDEDGSSYLLSEDRDNGTHIYRLSEDCLDVVEDVACLRGARSEFGYESPTMVRRDGVYYWFGSQLTGWSTNDNMYATAEHLAGPWSPWRPFAPAGSRTFDSQCDAVIALGDNPFCGDRFVYVGDRWRPDDLGASPTVWLPIRVGGGEADLSWYDQWRLDL